MKLSAQEEYGLRCLLRLARHEPAASMTIAELGLAEGISSHYVAKLLRILRRGGFVKAARGQAGGYTLARAASQIVVGEALALLGGRLYEPAFCNEHSGSETSCTNTVDCSIRSLWRTVQLVVDQVLARTTLKDLVSDEEQMTAWAGNLVHISAGPLAAAEAGQR
ncbi:MAG TPA: Rrf2 family transcriptional regulator [Terriglobia bacterium]|jgi:Rrf2 family protein|nr:Rrf2 family transcriptional regulator [Terriglobia bacterium]